MMTYYCLYYSSWQCNNGCIVFLGACHNVVSYSNRTTTLQSTYTSRWKGGVSKIYDNTHCSWRFYFLQVHCIVWTCTVCLRQHENTGANTRSKDKNTTNSYLKKKQEHIIIPRHLDFMYKQTHNRQDLIGSTVSLYWTQWTFSIHYTVYPWVSSLITEYNQIGTGSKPHKNIGDSQSRSSLQ